MYRVVAFVLIAALWMPASIAMAAAPRAGAPQAGTIDGTVTTEGGQAAPNRTVRLRNVQTNEIVGTTTSGATGGFTFNVPAGQYIAEVVDSSGNVLVASAALALGAGTSLPVTVVLPERRKESPAVAILIATAAAAAGIAAAIAVSNTASPSS
jgi:hypothetical protein